MYLDRVLLRLRRQYSKDEYVAALLKQIKEKDLEIGMLKSERDEALYLCEKLQRNKEILQEINKEATIRAKKEDRYINLQKQNKSLRKRVEELQKIRSELVYKLNS